MEECGESRGKAMSLAFARLFGHVQESRYD